MRASFSLLIACSMAFAFGASSVALAAAPPPRPTDRFGDAMPHGAVARFGTLRFRDPRGVYSLAFTDGGRYLHSRSGYVPVPVWRADSGTVAHGFGAGSKDQLKCLSLSPADWRKSVGVTYSWRAWNFDPDDPGDELVPFDEKESAASVAHSCDGSLVALGGLQGRVRIWDVRRGRLLHTLQGPPHPASGLCFSPDGKTLAAVTGPKHLWAHFEHSSIRLYDVATGKALRKLEGHPPSKWFTPNVNSMAFFDGGKLLATAALDSDVRVWHVATGELARTLPGEDLAVAAHPNGSLLALGGKGDVRLYDYRLRKEVRRIESPYRTLDLAFSPDGKKLAGAGPDRLARLWDVATGEPLHPTEGHSAPVGGLAFSADGTRLATFSSDGDVLLWDARDACLLRRVRLSGGERHPVSAPRHDGFSMAADASGFAALADAGPAFYSFDKGKAAVQGEAKRAPGAVALSPDGRLAVAAAEGGLCLWDVRTGKKRRVSVDKTHDRGEHGVAFAPDGRTFVSGSAGELRLWDARTAEVVAVFPVSSNMFHDFQSVEFARDGRSLVIGGVTVQQQRIWVVEAASGTVACTLELPHYPRHAALSPDGSLIAWCFDGNRDDYHVSDAFTGREVARLEGHKGGVACAAFSPDGRRLATGAGDTTALLWDATRFASRVEPRRLTEAEMRDAFDSLARPDAKKAYAALRTLRSGGTQTVEFLAARVRPVPKIDAARLRALVARLGDEDAAARDAASAELEPLASAEAPALREALASADVEAKRRLARLLSRSRPGSYAPAELQALRAARALEAAGGLEAVAALRRLSAGHPEAPLTRDARAAVARLAR